MAACLSWRANAGFFISLSWAVFGCGGVNLPQGKCFIPIIFPQQFYPIKMFGLGANMVGE